MKKFLFLSVVVVVAYLAPAGFTGERTIRNNQNLMSQPLHSLLTPAFYEKIIAAPIENWIVVRGVFTKGRLKACKISRSDAPNYNSLALGLANDLKFPGSFSSSTGSNLPDHPCHLDVLLYNIDGRKLALCLVHLEDSNTDGASLFALKDHTYSYVPPGQGGVRAVSGEQYPRVFEAR